MRTGVLISEWRDVDDTQFSFLSFFTEMGVIEMNEEIGPEKSLVVSDATRDVIEANLDVVFNSEPAEMQAAAELLLQSLNEDDQADIYEPMQLALQSVWSYAHAMNGVITGSSTFEQAFELFQQAAEGFDSLRLENLRDLSIGFAIYSQAITDMRQMNISQAIDRLRSVEQYLEHAGKYSRKFKPLIDHMKPETLFASAVRPLQELDFATAGTLTEEAANAADYVADTYYDDDEMEKSVFRGYGHLYRAFYELFLSNRELQLYEFDRIAQNTKLVRKATRAREALVAAKDFSEPVRIAANLSEILELLTEVVQGLAQIMKKVFESRITPERLELGELRQKLQRARDFASKAGPQGAVFIRFSEQLANQTKNLERLVRPTKKDFGIYSGLVAAGVFVLVLLVTAWTNSAFGLGLVAERLITTNLVLALIAGFGFGAVKFRNLIFARNESEEVSS